MILRLLVALLPLVAPAGPRPRGQVAGQTITVAQWADGQFDEEPAADAGKWRPDGQHVVSLRPEAGGMEVDLIDPATGKSTTVVPAAILRDEKSGEAVRAEDVALSDDARHALIFGNSRRVWRQNTRGDYWVWSAGGKSVRKIGGSAGPSSLMFAKLSPDGSKVAYVSANNLYAEDVASGAITSLTTDGAEKRINGTSDWVYEEELDVRDAWRWSPDGKSIAYWQFDTTPEPTFTLIDDTDALYPTVKRFPYPLAGQPNATVRIGVVSASGGPTVWMKDEADSASGYIVRMDWAANSDQLIFQHLNRLQTKDIYVLADAHTGSARPVFTDVDPHWVDVKDTGENGVRWIYRGREFLVLSERDGWRHVYAVSRDTGTPRLLTRATFDVDEVSGVDEAAGLLYFTASPGNATQRYLYAAKIDGSAPPERVTPAGLVGTNEYDIAPIGGLAYHTVSRLDTPPAHDLIRLPTHATIRDLGRNDELRARLRALRMGPIQFRQFKAADGEPMDASVILPPAFDPKHRYPLLFYVYGEPAATLANDQWGGWNAMFDWIVAQRGYIVVRVDNRGTPALKGRAWRRAGYRHVSALASLDQSAAARQLAALPYVDPARIAVWGWSGGGSMTLSLLFRYPEIYRLGMAVAPVADAHLYDSIYQERYLGLPQTDDAPYQEDSPINLADRSQRPLLLIHGSGDDNVHMAGTERLVNRLVANNKPFQLMIYPNRTHALDEGAGTTRHMFDLLLRFLTEHVPPG